MALARRYPRSIKKTPNVAEILTADPVQPPKRVTEATIIFLVILVGGILFAVSVVVFQPILLFIHDTPYPNLAATSLTSLLLATLWLSLITLAFLLHWSRLKWKRSKSILMSLFVILFLPIMLLFFFLLFKEVSLWILNKVQIQIYWESFKQFYSGLLGLIGQIW